MGAQCLEGGARAEARRVAAGASRDYHALMTLHALATAGGVVGLRGALARGALVDERHEGWTPLMCAAKSDCAGVDALAVLVENGADLEAERKANKHTE